MIVMKFGGTSLQDADCIRRAIDIVAQHRSRHPVVVVSAIGRTTRALVELGEAALTSGHGAAAPLLEGLLTQHRVILNDLHPPAKAAARAETGIQELGLDIARLLEGVSLLQQLTSRTLDGIVSHGERFSTLLFAAGASAAGLDVVRVDATKVMITDARYGMARPDRDELRTRARATLQPLLDEDRVPVMEGFIGSTPEGAITTMGFEASDYTASLLGAALDAEEIQIWTDVGGVLTTGLDQIENVLTIRELSFHEAAELSFFGAKVLHPKTIDPAVEGNIPVRILHSRNPAGTGTVIFGAPTATGVAVKSIALKEGIIVVRVKPRGPARVHGMLKVIGETLDRHEVVAHILAFAGQSATMAIEEGPNLQKVCQDLEQFLEVTREEGCAIVSLVGSGAGKAPGIAARATMTVGDIPISLLSYGASDTSVSLVVSEGEAQDVVARLHREFFGQGLPDSVFFPTNEVVQA